MKNTIVVAEYAVITSELGASELHIRGTGGEKLTVVILSSTVPRLAEELLAKTNPTQLVGSSAIPKIDSDTAQELARLARLERSQSAGFAVHTWPERQLSFLSLRGRDGTWAEAELQADSIQRVIRHLSKALAALSSADGKSH